MTIKNALETLTEGDKRHSAIELRHTHTDIEQKR